MPSVTLSVIRNLLLLPLLLIASCDFDGPFNKIPCRYDLTALHDTLKHYRLWTWGEWPKGFRSKSAYNPSDLDSTSWDIYLGIDSSNKCFLNEPFVMMLAQKVFEEPANSYFRHITFQLKQAYTRTGSMEVIYKINRDADTTGIRKIPESRSVQVIQKQSEGVANAGKYGTWKIVGLEVDSIPENAYEIAKAYQRTHRQFQDVEIYVKHVPSSICKEVKFLFWFETDAAN